MVEGTGLRLWQLFPTNTQNGLYNFWCKEILRPVSSVVKSMLSHQPSCQINPMFESHLWQMLITFKYINSIETPCGVRKSPLSPHGLLIDSKWRIGIVENVKLHSYTSMKTPCKHVGDCKVLKNSQKIHTSFISWSNHVYLLEEGQCFAWQKWVLSSDYLSICTKLNRSNIFSAIYNLCLYIITLSFSHIWANSPIYLKALYLIHPILFTETHPFTVQFHFAFPLLQVRF